MYNAVTTWEIWCSPGSARISGSAVVKGWTTIRQENSSSYVAVRRKILFPKVLRYRRLWMEMLLSSFTSYLKRRSLYLTLIPSTILYTSN